MYILTGTFGGTYVRFELPQGQTSLGRGSRNDIDLDHNSVSRVHAEFTVEGDKVLLKDLKSANGTFVNGQLIKEPVQIQHKDVISFGAQQMTLLLDKLAETSPVEQGRSGERTGSYNTDLGAQVGLAPGTGQSTFGQPASGGVAGGDSSDLSGETPAAALHNTLLSLSEDETISSQETMSWDEITGEVVPAASTEVVMKVLNEFSNQIITMQPISEVLDQLLRLVEEVVTARRIMIAMTDTPDGEPRIRAARPSIQSAGQKAVLSRTIVDTVLEDHQALLLNDAQNDPNFGAQHSIIYSQIRSAMVAPLFDNNEVIGLLYADSDDPGVRYDRSQLRVFSLLANLIAVKITNARLLKTEEDRIRLEREAEAARQVQGNLLPKELPAMENFEVAARMYPCYEVAGDLYDVRQLNDGRVAVVIGDVTGKGMAAAMLAANVVAGLDNMLFDDYPRLEVIAERLHRQVLKRSDTIHFVTFFFGLLDPKSGQMDYFNAGHNPPLLLLKDQDPQELMVTGMPLGLMPGATYTQASVTLPENCMLCLFSDGIPEALVDEEFYGEDRLMDSARERCRMDLEEVIDGVFEDLRTFVNDAPLDDDATLLLLRRCGHEGTTDL